jgi:hypothetical protein
LILMAMGFCGLRGGERVRDFLVGWGFLFVDK